MSFAVIHMQKIKTGGVKGVNNHNERLKISRTNPDIDYDKSYLNKNLYEGDKDKTYYNRIRDRIKELNLPKAVRKDAVVMCGFICTSDKKFFDGLTQSDKDRFFKESYNFIKRRYGEKNIIAANVHYDEKTPHMHCFITPITKDGRLSAKKIFTRAELKELQNAYPKYMKEKGFNLERGIDAQGKSKHLDTQEFKLQTKQQEITKEIDNISKLENALKNRSEALQTIKQSLYDLQNLEAKKSLLGNKMTISKDDYDNLMNLAKQGIISKDELKDLRKDVSDCKENLKGYRKFCSELTDKCDELRRDKRGMTKKYDNLKQQGKAMFNTLEKHNLVPEAQNELQNLKALEHQKTHSKSLEMER